MTTIQVEDSYKLARGDTLDFTDESAFSVSGTTGPSVILNGAVTVHSDLTDRGVWGVDGSFCPSPVTLKIGADGSLSVTATSDSVIAVGARFKTGGEVTNLGLIEVMAGSVAIGLQTNGGEVINSGRIVVTSQTTEGSGVIGPGRLVNAGSLEVFGANQAVGAEDTVDNLGTIHVSGGTTLGVDAYGAFHNAGDILCEGQTAVSVGVRWRASVGTFDNEGSIVVTSDAGGAIGVSLTPPLDDIENVLQVFTNSGLIQAQTAFKGFGVPAFDPRIVLNNSGQLMGDVVLASHDDRLNNSGKIVGDVQLLAGDDVYRTLAKGQLVGTVHSGDGDDLLIGGKKAERFDGDGGSHPGVDTLIGGKGADTLAGGGGADRFVYLKLSDSTAAHGDLITDLQDGDTIDLAAIDANANKAGDQAFHLAASFTHHAGELVLTYDADADLTTLTADVDGDGAADLVVRMVGDQSGFTGFAL